LLSKKWLINLGVPMNNKSTNDEALIEKQVMLSNENIKKYLQLQAITTCPFLIF